MAAMLVLQHNFEWLMTRQQSFWNASYACPWILTSLMCHLSHSPVQQYHYTGVVVESEMHVILLFLRGRQCWHLKASEQRLFPFFLFTLALLKQDLQWLWWLYAALSIRGFTLAAPVWQSMVMDLRHACCLYHMEIEVSTHSLNYYRNNL
jgi:hypothetical protein